MMKPKDHIILYCPVLSTTRANHLSTPENLALQRARLGLSKNKAQVNLKAKHPQIHQNNPSITPKQPNCPKNLVSQSDFLK